MPNAWHSSPMPNSSPVASSRCAATAACASARPLRVRARGARASARDVPGGADAIASEHALRLQRHRHVARDLAAPIGHDDAIVAAVELQRRAQPAVGADAAAQGIGGLFQAHRRLFVESGKRAGAHLVRRGPVRMTADPSARARSLHPRNHGYGIRLTLTSCGGPMRHFAPIRATRGRRRHPGLPRRVHARPAASGYRVLRLDTFGIARHRPSDHPTGATLMQFTAEHRQLSDTVTRFVKGEINPFVKDWEAAGQYPAHEVMAKLGRLGLLGLKYPEAFGGAGLDFSYSMVMAEALGICDCGGVPMSIGVQTDMATPALARFGSDELRREYLAPAIAGEMVACIGVSEPGGGSDVAAVRTSARKDGGDYVIDGTKMWITNGLQADWCCLLANTGDQGAPHKNKSLIIVPMDAPGITKHKIRKIGMNASDTAQLFFDRVRVPRRNLIGQEGMGFMFQMMQFQEERLWAAACGISGLDLTIDQTIEYTRQRQAFGKSILDNQVVHFRLAELRTEVEALRALTYRAVELYVSGKDVTRLASMAKLKCGRLRSEE